MGCGSIVPGQQDSVSSWPRKNAISRIRWRGRVGVVREAGQVPVGRGLGFCILVPIIVAVLCVAFLFATVIAMLGRYEIRTARM